MRCPYNRSVILILANTNYNLFALLQAADASVNVRKVQYIQIQLDTGAGAANLFIGDPINVSSTNCGAHLNAGQAFPIQSLKNYAVNLDDFGLRSDVAGVQVNVSVVI